VVFFGGGSLEGFLSDLDDFLGVRVVDGTDDEAVGGSGTEDPFFRDGLRLEADGRVLVCSSEGPDAVLAHVRKVTMRKFEWISYSALDIAEVFVLRLLFDGSLG
jgi:hypothetical protein